jgi:hypothetical protein
VGGFFGIERMSKRITLMDGGLVEVVGMALDIAQERRGRKHCLRLTLR